MDTGWSKMKDWEGGREGGTGRKNQRTRWDSLEDRRGFCVCVCVRVCACVGPGSQYVYSA